MNLPARNDDTTQTLSLIASCHFYNWLAVSAFEEIRVVRPSSADYLNQVELIENDRVY
jgi:hypothetical protein